MHFIILCVVRDSLLGIYWTYYTSSRRDFPSRSGLKHPPTFMTSFSVLQGFGLTHLLLFSNLLRKLVSHLGRYCFLWVRYLCASGGILFKLDGLGNLFDILLLNQIRLEPHLIGFSAVWQNPFVSLVIYDLESQGGDSLQPIKMVDCTCFTHACGLYKHYPLSSLFLG